MTHTRPPSDPLVILLVEDNPADVLLTREGLEETELPYQLHHAENGEQALAFLRRQPPYEQAPSPDLILLDLNMPVMDGRELMARIAGDDDLKHLAVVVLTMADADEEVLRMYQLGSRSYVRKPVDFTEFVRVVKGICQYWFQLVVLPPKSRAQR